MKKNKYKLGDLVRLEKTWFSWFSNPSMRAYGPGVSGSLLSPIPFAPITSGTISPPGYNNEFNNKVIEEHVGLIIKVNVPPDHIFSMSLGYGYGSGSENMRINGKEKSPPIEKESYQRKKAPNSYRYEIKTLDGKIILSDEEEIKEKL